MKQQRARKSVCGIVMLGLMALAPVAVQADDDHNIYSRLKELRLEQESAAQMASSETRQSGSGGSVSSRGVRGPVRSDQAGDAWADQDRELRQRLGGIGGTDTN